MNKEEEPVLGGGKQCGMRLCCSFAARDWFSDFVMIHDYDIRRRADAILIGIALDHAVLDFETTEGLLRDCLIFLDTPHSGPVDMAIGNFGPFRVRLNKHDDDLSIFVDGPSFETPRELCAAIWLTKQDLRRVINAALSGSEG